MCLQTLKSPMMAATIHEARGETQRTLTLSAAIAIVKGHGLDLAVLLAVLAFIGYAAI